MICRGADRTRDGRVAQQSLTGSPTCRRLSPDFALFPFGYRDSFLPNRRDDPKNAKSADPGLSASPTTRWGNDCPLRQHVDRDADERALSCGTTGALRLRILRLKEKARRRITAHQIRRAMRDHLPVL